MTVRIDNPKFRNEYALNDLQAQIDALDFDGVENDLAALKQSVANAQSTADTALGTAQVASGVANAAAGSASNAQATANQAKAKTDKLTINASAVEFINVNGTNNSPGLKIKLPGYDRFLYWTDYSLSLWNSNANALQWSIRSDMFKHRSFTVKTDLRVVYMYGTLIVNLSGITVTFDTSGNWIRIATLAELGVSTYVGATPMYAAATLDYEYGYEGTLRLGPEGLHARAAGSRGGSRYVYGQVTAFAWPISSSSPISQEREHAPSEDDMGMPISDDNLEFAIIGG